MAADWNIVVPVRAFASGKSRLRRSLEAGVVTELARRLAFRTLAVLEAVPEIARVCVVTGEERAALAQFSKVGVVREEAPVGLNAAVELGFAELSREVGDTGAGVLVLHADLPLLTVESVRELLAACAQVGPNGWVGDRAGSGTTALSMLDPKRRRPHSFGAGSGERHLRAGFAAVQLPAWHPTRCDLDTFDDLVLYSQTPHWRAIAELVQEIPVGSRMKRSPLAHAE